MKKETLIRLGENLKVLRIVNKFSQDEMAESIGTCRSIYTHYELGTRTPDPEALYILANKLGVNMSTLFETDEERFLSIIASARALRKDEEKLLYLYNRMSPFHKGNLMERALVLTEIEDEEIEKKKSIMTEAI